ncbi:peptide chain release factor N(5)-glutamine methyltransferase [Alteribacter natronophilus]|uniref:peptide chain release factor N(5)-glutamine methyltransferase n=1 Tax=Alteribacter natronophilus TaxID=2583810 RepID=UPI00110E98DE|nr:peptide chain release factor N(5)-glutamine methyltransferase [Alteribacter natronophilus]TMW72154.1 peptide chain release factor N(5)-glutamine methyltransferase [Alteribacter natronophilus]
MSVRIYEALQRASSFLEKQNVERGVAEVLLSHHTGWSRSRWLAELQSEMDAGIFEAFWADVERASTGVPVQHLTGVEQFYGLEFRVSPDVLIPRPETEELVDGVLREIKVRYPDERPLRIVDVGTGSGIIAVTLAKELSERAGEVTVEAVDISAAALETARENARVLGADVRFWEGDLLEPLLLKGATVDIVVSNPPYIPEGERENLAVNVREFDPATALFGGEDGLVLYRRMAEQLPWLLAVDGFAAFEIGYDQGESVPALMRAAFGSGWRGGVEVRQDLNGNDRMVFVYR